MLGADCGGRLPYWTSAAEMVDFADSLGSLPVFGSIARWLCLVDC